MCKGGKQMASEHQEKTRYYIAIDLKSFYASVECRDRRLDPMTTNLVVADRSRTSKTICLAVSPSLKAYGIGGRARLFEVEQMVAKVNAQRRKQAPGGRLLHRSSDDRIVQADPSVALDYIVAPPQMAHYMACSTEIYNIYLQYFAPEDMHVYSIDEVMIDVTSYLDTYGMSPRQLAGTVMRKIYEKTGITATAGIGTNLYLCKVAMDIVAKHVTPDADGVRIGELDEITYRKLLWSHRPLTDFWRVGPGYARKLETYGLYTMGDIARCSLGKPGEYYNEDLLYKLFGINAELLIDHAWGWEPCRMADVKSYKPETNSICSGQVLQCPYTSDKARLVVQEMADMMGLDLVDKGMVTDQLVLTVGYDIDNLTDPKIRKSYRGPMTTDRYGRQVPKHAHGTQNLKYPTSSSMQLMAAAESLYDRIINTQLLVRRITLTANRVVVENSVKKQETFEQMDLFTDYAKREAEEKKEQQELEKEKKLQRAMLDIKKKYGKNAVLKGMNLQEGATARNRNGQIGGHKA